MTKPNLLIATDNFLPRWDGIARFLYEIIPDLTDKYNVTVLAPNFGKYKPKGFRLVKIKKSKFGLGDYIAPKFSYRAIQREVKKADIVFTQTIGPIGMLSIICAKQKKKKLATFIHSLEWELVPMATKNLLLRRILSPLTKLFTRILYNKPDLLILPSSFLADALAWRGINTKKFVATLGVNCSVFKPLSERSDVEKKEILSLKKDLGLEDSFVVGNHGRLANEKDLSTLIRGFQWFRKKHKNAKLLVIGDGLSNIKEKLSKTKGCIHISSKNDVYKYLNLMDVYVTSSLTETTSLTTLEAMASGLVVISTPVGFIKEYISPRTTGLFFKPKNSFDLFKKLDLVKTDSVKSSRMSINARKLVIDDFQWRNTSDNIKEALDSLNF